MRKLYQAQMPNIPPQVQAVFNEIFRASQDGDIIDIGQAYSFVDGSGAPASFTTTRKLNVATPTVANISAVLATLLQDLQRGGTTRTT